MRHWVKLTFGLDEAVADWDGKVSVQNGKTLTIATRDELGDNRIFCAYLFVPGTGRYARADVVVLGTADTVAPDCVRVENMVSDTLSRDVTWATDGRSLQISNTSGEERDVRWSLVAVASYQAGGYRA